MTCTVNEVPCKDCDFVYVGHTIRDLNFRSKEHRRAIKQQKPENSTLCEHVILFDHVIDWTKSRILKTEKNFSERLTEDCLTFAAVITHKHVKFLIFEGHMQHPSVNEIWKQKSASATSCLQSYSFILR